MSVTSELDWMTSAVLHSLMEWLQLARAHCVFYGQVEESRIFDNAKYPDWIRIHYMHQLTCYTVAKKIIVNKMDKKEQNWDKGDKLKKM